MSQVRLHQPVVVRRTDQVRMVGFTLIEVLVVLAIIGILAAFVLTSIHSTHQKAVDTAIISIVKQVRSLAEIYYASNGASYANFADCFTHGGCQGGIDDNLAALKADMAQYEDSMLMVTSVNDSDLVPASTHDVCIAAKLTASTDPEIYACMDARGLAPQTHVCDPISHTCVPA